MAGPPGRLVDGKPSRLMSSCTSWGRHSTAWGNGRPGIGGLRGHPRPSSHLGRDQPHPGPPFCWPSEAFKMTRLRFPVTTEMPCSPYLVGDCTSKNEPFSPPARSKGHIMTLCRSDLHEGGGPRTGSEVWRPGRRAPARGRAAAGTYLRTGWRSPTC